MDIVELIAAYFYLQPSLIFTFVPVQGIALFLLLLIHRKSSLLKALLHAFCATLVAVIMIVILGSMVVPIVHVSLMQSLRISFVESIVLIGISSCVYWLCISFYLRYFVRLPGITILSALSSAIAGSTVLVVYYLVWRY